MFRELFIEANGVTLNGDNLKEITDIIKVTNISNPVESVKNMKLYTERRNNV